MPDFTTKNVAIATVLVLDVLFLTMAVASYGIPWLAEARKDLWTLFLATNQSLFLLLNCDSKSLSPK